MFRCLVLLCVLSPSAAFAEGSLNWIADDYSSALAKAKAANKPLVIDMWAPWCHTCLSMKHYVLTDPSLKPYADRFVWLVIDTDREVNAGVVGKYAIDFWPTFFVVSPGDESVQARYVGSAPIKAFREFLNQGEQGHLDQVSAKGGLAKDSPLRWVRTGDQASTSGEYGAAASAYETAMENAPKDWDRSPDVLVAWVGALHKQEAWKTCTLVAEKNLEAAARGRSAAGADFAYFGYECAKRSGDAALAVRVRDIALKCIAGLVDDPESSLSVDDRSDALRIMRDMEEDAGRKDAAKALARRQQALLDEATTKAGDAISAMTYNWPRAEVYVYLGEPAKLVPSLKQSVAALPKQYDPPYRLAWVYLNHGKHAEALAMANTALALVYGPRKARVQELIADIHKAAGDPKAERTAREAVVKILEALPEGQKRPKSIEQAKAELAKLGPS